MTMIQYFYLTIFIEPGKLQLSLSYGRHYGKDNEDEEVWQTIYNIHTVEPR